MNFTEYQIVYLLSSLFGLYTIYKFMRLFFDQRISGKWIEFSSYLAYNVVISVVYFYIDIPLILLFVNIGAFIALTFNYKATPWKRVLGSLYVFLILMTVEVVIGVASGFFGISTLEKSGFDNSASLILVRFASYMLVLLLGKIKRARAGQDISFGNWVSVIGIPTVSMYLVIIVFQASGIQEANVVAAITGLLVINVLVFHLYDRLQLQAEADLERELLLQQNKYYDNQFRLMKSSEDSLKAIRHDWKNHMSALASLIDKNSDTDAKDYIGKLIETSNENERHVDTGNMEIDSILNAKFQEAANKGLAVKTDIAVPEKLALSPFDLTVLLGNLLDNAIEASTAASESGSIDFSLRYSKNRLLMDISNPIANSIEMKDGLPKTTKKDSRNHGIGLRQVARTLEKYNGDMELSIEDGRFKVSTIMFVEQE